MSTIGKPELCSSPQEVAAAFDPYEIRKDFPILNSVIKGKPLVFLDSAASSQKPRVVINTLKSFYEESYANIHRGVYHLSSLATDAFERARVKIKDFIGAERAEEIIFVRGTTEAINLVAQSFGRMTFKEGDEILLSAMEHHANIVPWQLLRDQLGLTIKVIPMNDKGELLLDEYKKLFTSKTRMVGVNHVSNALGTVNPVKEMTQIAHEHDVPILVDGAQGSPHFAVDVKDIGCDFYTISGHKMYGPSGVGALYGKIEHLKQMPPYQGGGDMIRYVSFEKTMFADPPARFEAGTPDIAGGVGLGAAVDYLNNIGMDKVHAYGKELLEYGTEVLSSIDGLRFIGTAEEKTSILAFVLEGVHPHDIGTVLDSLGIAVRTGHHCAQPVMDFFQVPATTRASLSLYNVREDIDKLAEGLRKVIEVFR
jgi:cysteine desulfurase/selenocysteine lyase